MHVVIFTGGTARPGPFTKQALDAADFIIAADSGAKTALDFQVFPEVVIGDFDSIDGDTKQALQEKGCKFIECSPEKDYTDTQLAVRYALDHKADRITLLGGIEGDRIDHILTNIFSLIEMTVPMRCVNGSTAVWVEKGPKTAYITGRSKDLLSLIPLSPEVTGMKGTGLQYSLGHETIFHEMLIMGKAAGISNVLIENQASVTFKQGALLFVHISAD